MQSNEKEDWKERLSDILIKTFILIGIGLVWAGFIAFGIILGLALKG